MGDTTFSTVSGRPVGRDCSIADRQSVLPHGAPPWSTLQASTPGFSRAWQVTLFLIGQKDTIFSLIGWLLSTEQCASVRLNHIFIETETEALGKMTVSVFDITVKLTVS